MKHITTLLVTLSLFFTGICFAQDENLTEEAAALRELVAAAERAALEPPKPAAPKVEITAPAIKKEVIPAPPSAAISEVKLPPPPELPSPPSAPSVVIDDAPIKTITNKVAETAAPPATGLPKPPVPAAEIEKAIAEFDPPKLPNESLEIKQDFKKPVNAADEIKKAVTEEKETVEAATSAAVSKPKPTPKKITTSSKPKVTKKVEEKAEEPVAIVEKAEEPAASATPKKKGKKLGEILFPKRGGIFKKKQQQQP